ncbi:UDP-N-acetylglucosamine 1-carboxyvinyltransferase [Candidatus Falkowbacteria bacterium CG23_combo_of_CG06-09_8_20_14_all_49_15]|uniref:UDP-N-acetylglucosamine 1-carboxyvinyltransferase n=1 Tax=Candidatus Falkowbacteria bacterium CG23_combo_of_CG06-09_8_20_14_all_49_15 TaxID=1974572 RepID=A0A2G9ZKG3_9BACT|nr:MAG: UDP-N-acetylglucosamine 1-carboxyvinyltransferase [Candidatus Falkowbacteria bacterium CG23_combo_of_CG06-09_8_20_14_all_49_15]
MAKFIIQGQNKLRGEIAVRGAKNAALKIIPVALLSDETLLVENLPQIEDVDKALEAMASLGAKIKRTKKDACAIDASAISSADLSARIAGRFRAAIMFAGPLLARSGAASFFSPGGCNLASGSKRPINLFLDGFKKFGASIRDEDGHFFLRAKRWKAARIFFPIVSVTATEAMMTAAVLAAGTTVLDNCALEPEIPALADYLNQQGAKITGAGTPRIVIQGVKKIHAGKFFIPPDRIETGSFALMAAALKSPLTITGCQPEHIMVLLEIFRAIGVPCRWGRDCIVIKAAKKIRPYSIKTHEYPGFPTDLQSPYTLLMTQAHGSCLIHETIYDRRLLYVDMLMQMGADIVMCDPHRVVVNGPTKLYGKKLVSPDLRAGLTLLLAGLLAEGQTEIGNIYQIDRGYEDIDGRLRALGAKIKRVND